MKLSQLAAPVTTTFEVILLNDEPSGVFITANTADSKEWVKADKKYSKPQDSKQTLIMGKKGEQPRLEIDNDGGEARKKSVIAMVTDITGLEDFTFSKAAATELLNDPQYTWIYMQLAEHLSDRSNYFLG